MNTKSKIQLIKVKRATILLLGICLLFAFPVNALSYRIQSTQKPTSTPTSTPVSTPTVAPSESQVEILEQKVQNLETNIQTQSEAYSATVSRMEANMNFLLAVMAIASLLVAFLGFGVVRIWIRQLVEERIQKVLSQEVNNLANKEIERMRNEWDPKFAALYDEYRKTVTRK